jgi:uncharacterized protein (DUF1501 family)|tara:strand:- start:1273 stop:2409 length:1137 start_codon:yes stop_codon:yes gene_type:complete
VVVKREKVLVVIQLSGGNDYLNCIVPYENGHYKDARPNIKITDDQVIPLDKGYGLNPGMNPIKDLYDQGKVAIIHGIGYPVPNRSHFRSMDIWHTAEPTTVGSKGWLGQAIAQLDPIGRNVVTAVNFANGLPRALAAPNVPVASVADLENYGLLTGVAGAEQRNMALNTFSRMYTPLIGSGAVMDYLGQTGLDAMRGADILKEGPKRYTSNVEYPENPFAKSMKAVAQVHFADLGTRIFYTQYGSFDTHTDEVALQKRLWEDISSSVAAFFQDLEEHQLGDEVTILMFSEFGRRVRDNGTGTDHGSGGVAFILGNQIKGGHYNEYPSLDPVKLIEGDLAFNNDFRGLYTDILEDWLEVEARPIVNGVFEKVRPFSCSD